MGMEIMRPQGCLIKRAIVSPAVIHHHHHHRKRGYMNPRFGNKKSPEKEGRFDNGTVKNCKSNSSSSSSNLVIGRVRILKRGESPQMQMQAGDIDRKARRISADDVITSRINRLGSESDTATTAAAVEIKFMADMYAGSAFSMSPSPRSLPLPSFFNIKTQAHSQTVDDSATIGLRRLLRLE